MNDQDPAPIHGDPTAFVIDDQVAIALLADIQIRAAMARGDFDDLPGSGMPLNLPDHHDPDWWLKSLMEREHVVLLPPSIQLRKDDATLNGRLDEMSDEGEVRREIDEFNKRVIRARYDLPAGPPLITMPRDVEATVTAWGDRRARRAEKVREQATEESPEARPRRLFSWTSIRRLLRSSRSVVTGRPPA